MVWGYLCLDSFQQYQRHRHLNLPLDQKFHLIPQAHFNFDTNLMYSVLQSLIFMAVVRLEVCAFRILIIESLKKK